MAQLIDVANGYHLWSERYEKNLEDIFAIQDEITLAIVEKLKIGLLAGEKEKIIRRYTENEEAYNLYLQGRYFWNRRDEGDLKTAIEYFEQAIRMDPDFAIAYAGLADTYNMFQGYGILGPADVLPKARAMALKALEIDKNLAEAHVSLAFVSFWYDWDWDVADAHFKEALRLNPNYGHAHQWYGFFLTAIGRFREARQEFQEAIRMDPLSLINNSGAGWGLFVEGAYEQAVEQFRKTLVLEPNHPRSHFWLGQVLEQTGDLKQALIEFERAAELTQRSPQYLSALGHAYALAGRRSDAEEVLKALEEMGRQKYVSPLDRALIYVGLGYRDRAFEWLERACTEREGWIVFVNVDPRFDGLRSEPQFAGLLEKIGLKK